MSHTTDSDIIRAAARLFKDNPELSNLEALKRLVGTFGPELAERIRINRFERQVRQPALRLLRANGRSNGAPATREEGAGRGLEGRLPDQLARDIDEALVDAFALGAEADSDVEVVRAFRELDEIRKAVAGRLQGAV